VCVKTDSLFDIFAHRLCLEFCILRWPFLLSGRQLAGRRWCGVFGIIFLYLWLFILF